MFDDRGREWLDGPGLPVIELIRPDRVFLVEPGFGEHRPVEPVKPLDPQAQLLEDGAAHLDAALGLDAVIARAHAARARELAGFARCRPAAWDRQPGEVGAASAATRAARPAVLEPVSEWAVSEVAARLRLSSRDAQTVLGRAVFLVEALPATLAALEAGAISPAHADALVDLLETVSEDKRAQVEAEALERAGSQTVQNLRARVRRLVARIDAAAALRRLVTAAQERKVATWAGDDGMATLAATLPAPLVRACDATLTALAKACAVDEDGNPDPRSLDQRRADCFADLFLRPHADRPPVQIDLTLIASVDTMTGFGPGADAPGELDGDVIPAPLVRELAATFGLMPPLTPPPPSEAPSEAPAEPVVDVPAVEAVEASVDWAETTPVPGDEALEEQITALRAAETTAAAELAAAIDAEDRLVLAQDPRPEPADRADLLAAAKADREAALRRLFTAQQLTGTALAHRPHLALVDQLTGVLLSLTDSFGLRSAARAGLGLGPPPDTDGYEPSDPLRAFVMLRDRRCRFPGCRVRARCADLDHNVPHPHGPTSHCNLACLCEHHHRLSHQAPGWTLHREPDGTLVWTLPGGHVITTRPPAVGVDDAPDVTTRTRRRPRARNATLDAIRRMTPGAGAPDPDIPF